MPFNWKKKGIKFTKFALFPLMFVFGNILMLLILLRDFVPHKKIKACP